jgi:hypothetical protein
LLSFAFLVRHLWLFTYLKATIKSIFESIWSQRSIPPTLVRSIQVPIACLWHFIIILLNTF